MAANTGLAFVAGAAVGAVAALFLAPKSGQDLRAELVAEAKKDRERLEKEYGRTVDEVQRRLDEVHADVQETLDHVRQQVDKATEAQ